MRILSGNVFSDPIQGNLVIPAHFSAKSGDEDEPEIRTRRIMNTLPGVLEKPDCRSLKRYLADDPPRLKKYRLASAILELMTGRFRVSVISILGASPVRRRFRLDEGDIERIRGRIGADKGCHGMPSVQHPRKP